MVILARVNGYQNLESPCARTVKQGFMENWQRGPGVQQ